MSRTINSITAFSSWLMREFSNDDLEEERLLVRKVSRPTRRNNPMVSETINSMRLNPLCLRRVTMIRALA
jgi:hypothetical protein